MPPADDAGTSSPRLHALDNLRAILMWLGIVLHVAVIHVVGESPLPWRDGQRSMAADFLLAFIHAFRMPAFFILAGFFVALLIRSRGPMGMARHRFMRLGVPFALFWLPVFALSVVCALAFLHLMVRGTWGLDRSLVLLFPGVPEGPNTFHMWFLWQLLWFSLVAAALARCVPAHAFDSIGRALRRSGMAPWGAWVLALPLALAGWNQPHGILHIQGSFLPPPAEWLHHGMFFVFGVALFHGQAELFALYQRRWPTLAAAGFAFFVATGWLMQRGSPEFWIAYVYNVCSWLWSFAAIGIGLRLLSGRSAALAYLADSSYWVYLVHMPLTIGIGALLYGLEWHAIAKMAINIAATTAICLASYQLFVRATWVGQLLNGKRHPRRRFAAASVPTSAA